MSVLVDLGAHMHSDTLTYTHKHAECIHMSLAAVPASGSSLMHVDCTLEPLGMEPSGSVCPVHQQAFTEVPMTALIPALRDWLLVNIPGLFSSSFCIVNQVTSIIKRKCWIPYFQHLKCKNVLLFSVIFGFQGTHFTFLPRVKAKCQNGVKMQKKSFIVTKLQRIILALWSFIVNSSSLFCYPAWILYF